MFLSAVWTLILTAPIHCRGYIGEQVMLNLLNLSKSVQMKKLIHLHLGWFEGEHIFNKSFRFYIFFGELFL